MGRPRRRASGGRRHCRCWVGCRCCGSGTTSSRWPGSRPARRAPGPRPSRPSSLPSSATSMQGTGCKVLLTSRRDEQAWLGDLPARVALPADADAGTPRTRPGRRASKQAGAQRFLDVEDWRPLLEFTRATLSPSPCWPARPSATTTAPESRSRAFVDRLRAGAAPGHRRPDPGPGRVPGRLPRLRLQPRLHRHRTRHPGPAGPIPGLHRRRRPPRDGPPGLDGGPVPAWPG